MVSLGENVSNKFFSIKITFSMPCGRIKFFSHDPLYSLFIIIITFLFRNALEKKIRFISLKIDFLTASTCEIRKGEALIQEAFFISSPFRSNLSCTYDIELKIKSKHFRLESLKENWILESDKLEAKFQQICV